MRVQTSDRQVIPLKNINVNGELFDFFGRINVGVTFENKNTNPIEAVYVFTLDTSSKIFNFTVKMKDKNLVGVVREKTVAKNTYEKALDNKQKSSLLEKDKFGNYTLFMGNIQPDETVTIQYSYLVETITDNGKYKFVMPTNIGNKYTLNTPYTPYKGFSNSRLTREPPHIVSPKYTFNFNLNWKSKSHINNVLLTNNINNADIIKMSNNEYNVSVNMLPEMGDLVITMETTVENNLYLGKKGDDVYGMLISQIPDEDEEITPKEFVFFVDKSGSMNGSKLKSAKDAVTLFLQSLNFDSKINVIAFDDDFHSVFPKPEEFNEENKKTLLEFVNKLNASGGTELLKCMTKCLNNDIPRRNIKYESKSENKTNNKTNSGIVKIPGHVFNDDNQYNQNNNKFSDMERVYFLLTDGDVTDSDAVINAVKLHAYNTRIFTIGIGADASRSLVENIANETEGIYKMIADSKGVDEIVIDMLTNVYKTHYKNINVSFDGNNVLYNKKLYPGKYMTLFNKFSVQNTPEKDTVNVQINGINCSTGQNKVWNILADQSSYVSSETMELLYVSNLINNKEGKLSDKQIIDLCVKYNIMNDLASFIIVDEIINDQNENTIRMDIPHHSNQQNDMFLEDQYESFQCESLQQQGGVFYGSPLVKKVKKSGHNVQYERANSRCTKPSYAKPCKSGKLSKSIQLESKSSADLFSGPINFVADSFNSVTESVSNMFDFSKSNTPNSTVTKSKSKSIRSDECEFSTVCNKPQNYNKPQKQQTIDVPAINNNDILTFLKTDGHFEYTTESFNLVLTSNDEPKFKTYCAENKIDHTMLFNVVVFCYLENLNQNKFRMIIKNLKTWITKQQNITNDEFLTQVNQTKNTFFSNTNESNHESTQYSTQSNNKTNDFSNFVDVSLNC